MRADQLFAASDGFFPPDCALSGPFLSRYLLPFSIWHAWILRVMESPYIAGGVAQVEDYLQAVLVCSNTRTGYMKLLNDQEAMLKELGQLSIMFNGADEAERDSEVDDFSEYIDAGYKLPEYWTDPDQSNARRARIPYEWNLVSVILGMNICKTEVEAWDYALSRAACWSAVSYDGKGSDYMDEADREDCRKAEQLAKKAGEANG